MRVSDSWLCLFAARMLLATAVPIPMFASASAGTWTSGGPYGGFVKALAIAASAPSNMYAGTEDGATWKEARSGLTSPIYALAIDPSAPSTLYAGTDRDGAFKSTDSGGSWVNIGPDRDYPGPQVLTVDSRDPRTIYAGTDGRGV